MRFHAFRIRAVWSKRVQLIVVLACLTMIMVTGMTMLTDHIAGYREKVQPLLALDLNEDDQAKEDIREIIDYTGRPIDYSLENKWTDGYNNHTDMIPLNEDSMSRPYSFLWKEETSSTHFTYSPFCSARYSFDIARNWRTSVESFCEDPCHQTGVQTSEDNGHCATLNAVDSGVGHIFSRNSTEVSKFSIECSMLHLDIPENLCNTKNFVLHVDSLPQEPPRGTIDMFLAPGSTEAKCKLRDPFYNRPNWGYGG